MSSSNSDTMWYKSSCDTGMLHSFSTRLKSVTDRYPVWERSLCWNARRRFFQCLISCRETPGATVTCTLLTCSVQVISEKSLIIVLKDAWLHWTLPCVHFQKVDSKVTKVRKYMQHLDFPDIFRHKHVTALSTPLFLRNFTRFGISWSTVEPKITSSQANIFLSALGSQC